MPDLFFYGTLCHLPLLHQVLGHDRVKCLPATLPDHESRWVADNAFPMIQNAPGQAARGLLVRGLGDDDLARLDFYEGGFGYDLRAVTVQTDEGAAPAQVYFPQPGLWQPGAPWSLTDWQEKWAAVTLSAAEEAMARYGIAPPEEVRPLMPFFRARGWARQLAATPAPQTLRSRMTLDDVEILRHRKGYDGFFRIRAVDLQHRRFDGGRSHPVSREMFIAFDAALVLPYDPQRDEVLLIEQLRYGPIGRGDPAPWVLEPIAGLVDAGEDPADCARREAGEEAGLTLGDLRPMARVYASPGYTSEFFHCFLGLCSLADYRTGLGGLDSENEDIRSHVIPFDRAMELITTGEINAGPLVMMMLWLAQHRAGLRAAA
ncbi:NUDIX domain-containing protein [Thalassococcus sp. BH17M4-6]|uniref:NUDIX domain-containing protein n=1 Tax=Thalassococcus sp. BH17M4-6 TaxID=3413148 RepID=UPI003BD8EC97